MQTRLGGVRFRCSKPRSANAMGRARFFGSCDDGIATLRKHLRTATAPPDTSRPPWDESERILVGRVPWLKPPRMTSPALVRSFPYSA